MIFIDKCLSGNALIDEIEDYVDAWHDGKEGQRQELHEYLGMTWDEYSVWGTKPSVLPYIIASRKNGTSLQFELNACEYPREHKSLPGENAESWP